MPINFYSVVLSALATLLIGFVWYHPKVFGTIWMKESGMTEEKAKQTNKLKLFGLTVFFALIISFFMPVIVIHQMGALGMVGGPRFADMAKPSYAAFLADYGHNFRTFKHGALHGFMTGLFFILPILAFNGLFEQKTWRHILIHAGYWIISLTIVGGIVCGWE